MGRTRIEWTRGDDDSMGYTWNPIRGCSRVSSGCGDSTGGGCYAERQAYRFSGEGQPYHGLVRMTSNGPRWTGEVRLIEEHLEDPLRWKKPRRIFVNSMSDLFHEKLRDEDIDRVFAVMALSPQHTFQILTKRAERMPRYFKSLRQRIRGYIHGHRGYFAEILTSVLGEEKLHDAWMRMKEFHHGTEEPKSIGDATAWPWPLRNCWLGVSVEDQKTANERIPLLLQTPAAVRFLSCEPLLGPVDLTDLAIKDGSGEQHIDALRCEEPVEDCGDIGNAVIDWVVCGGESGPGARPMHPGWARSLRDQCQAANVPYFFKQWGEWLPVIESAGDIHYVATALANPPAMSQRAAFHDFEDGQRMIRVGKKAAVRMLDGREHNDFPNV